MVISGKEYRLAAGQIIKMAAGAPHSVKAVKKFKMLLIMIREKQTSVSEYKGQIAHIISNARGGYLPSYFQF